MSIGIKGKKVYMSGPMPTATRRPCVGGQMRMRYVSLFSGIEAASVAWEPLGWEPVAFSEIDPFPSAVLAQRFPDVPNLGDITKVDWSTYDGAVDIVVGGSPCQSFSVAGKREGLSGASGLMWEYIRAVQEIRPGWFVWENVPGALSSGHGDDFRCLLHEMDGLGYGLAWRVLDAQFFGVAQRRRRVFLVGCLGDAGRAAEVLFEPEGLRWDTPTSREKRQELAGTAGAGARGDSWAVMTAQTGGGGRNVWLELAPTLDAKCPGAVVTCFAANQRGEVRLSNGDGQITGAIPASQSGKQIQAVCMSDGNAHAAIDDNLAGCLKVGGEPPMVVYQSDSTPMVLYEGTYWTVRRLMPVECERLQGFPDGWTEIEYRGKPAADGPRYKALGNSMAVPVMRWIGERISDSIVRDEREKER